MKSRVVSTFSSVSALSAIGRRLPRGVVRPRLSFLSVLRVSRMSRAGVALGGAACVLTLSGCYYPYGYYPNGYYPYYATVPAGTVQQDVQVGSGDPSMAQQPMPPQTSAQAQAQAAQQMPPATYATAAVPPAPVYVAPAYPAYYPPPAYPAYPAYYGYPGWYGPSVSIGFGFGGYWGGHGGWGGHGHWH
ncbi:hypothetical protein LFL96_12855 [Paraburkholderia sp. D15]|uniref:hypothetical protein n=1 Tax=Paraburkholderia sp. D15 TaxID=2880218 RepID=UPI00247A7921|nr:hypothetical protein [Paraburkholderia sp. D15]WGS48672.1 hypothetical protein LFL96_12855 [Paraburkholderia sp. D15]